MNAAAGMPAYAPAGRVHALIARLKDDHGRIAHTTARLRRIADRLGTQPDWQQLSELTGFLRFFADRAHHPLEDRLFDRLLLKGITPTERKLIFKNLQQHEEIRRLTGELTKQIDEAVNGRCVSIADFLEQLDLYLELQNRHMRFEETQLFPLVEARFDDADWRAIRTEKEIG